MQPVNLDQLRDQLSSQGFTPVDPTRWGWDATAEVGHPGSYFLGRLFEAPSPGAASAWAMARRQGEAHGGAYVLVIATNVARLAGWDNAVLIRAHDAQANSDRALRELRSDVPGPVPPVAEAILAVAEAIGGDYRSASGLGELIGSLRSRHAARHEGPVEIRSQWEPGGSRVIITEAHLDPAGTAVNSVRAEYRGEGLESVTVPRLSGSPDAAVLRKKSLGMARRWGLPIQDNAGAFSDRDIRKLRDNAALPF